MRAQYGRIFLIVPLLTLILTSCGGAVAPSTSAPASMPGANLSESAPSSQSAAAPTASGGAAAPIAAPAVTPPNSSSSTQMPTVLPAAVADSQVAPTPQTEPAVPTPQIELDAPTPQTEVAVNPYTRTTDDPLSTFAMDVDTASYTAARNYINHGQLPPPNAVRVEEFVNFFHYSYPQPQDGAFAISVDAAPSPFVLQEGAQIVRVGIQGRSIDDAQRDGASLTFVIDISGSMAQPNRLPLVKRALTMLVNELRQDDQVAIVVYGSDANIVLDHTSAANRQQILNAIDSLQNSGSTNAEAGLRLGYSLAAEHFKAGGINRVILCSDGVANVGATGPDAIRESIRDYTAQGIYLTTVGFGMGDYNDQLMEQLADDGNGNYGYVDTVEAAQRIFVENLTGTLQVIARDAKIQVEFNPDVVGSYRLLGYENRAVADADFRNDRVDAGEVGSGHSVTALYEIIPTGQGSGTALTARVRYADPQGGEVHEIKQALSSAAFGQSFEGAAPQFQLAVAAASFAEQLRGSAYAQGRTLGDVQAIAERVAPQLANDSDAQDLLALIKQAQGLRGVAR